MVAERSGSAAWEDMCRQHEEGQQADGSTGGQPRGPCVLLRDDASDAAPISEPEEGTPRWTAATPRSAEATDEQWHSGRQIVRLRPSEAFLQNWNSHTSFHRRRRSRSVLRDRWVSLLLRARVLRVFYCTVRCIRHGSCMPYVT